MPLLVPLPQEVISSSYAMNMIINRLQSTLKAAMDDPYRRRIEESVKRILKLKQSRLTNQAIDSVNGEINEKLMVSRILQIHEKFMI